MRALSDNGDEQVALIGDARFDFGDCDDLYLVVSVYTSEAVASDQWLPMDSLGNSLLAMSKARDLADLRGYPVWITREGNRMNYVRPWSRKP